MNASKSPSPLTWRDRLPKPKPPKPPKKQTATLTATVPLEIYEWVMGIVAQARGTTDKEGRAVSASTIIREILMDEFCRDTLNLGIGLNASIEHYELVHGAPIEAETRQTAQNLHRSAVGPSK